MYRRVVSDELDGGEALIASRRVAIASQFQRLATASALAAPLALTVGCLLGLTVLMRGPPPRSADLRRTTRLFLGPGVIVDGVNQLAVDGVGGLIPNLLDGNSTLGGAIPGFPGTLAVTGDPNPFAENFSLSASFSSPVGGNFTLNAGLADQLGSTLALGSQVLSPLGNFSAGASVPNPFQGNLSLGASNPFGSIAGAGAADPLLSNPGLAFGDAVGGASAMNPFSGNASGESPWAGSLSSIGGLGIPFNTNLTVGGALGQAQGALQQAGETVAKTHPDYWPSYLAGGQEYYDNDTVIGSSWHWPSCDREHMYQCHGHLVDVLHACCCEAGFAYVAENAGTPVGNDAAIGVATGAAHGALITGGMLGGDLGSSTAAGAATGAASGALTGAMTYLLEGGECKAKSALPTAVQQHLS